MPVLPGSIGVIMRPPTPNLAPLVRSVVIGALGVLFVVSLVVMWVG
jgi:hypothetical protein